MTRARRRDARQRRYGLRFAKTVDEQVQHGIHWPDYRSPLSKYLMPRPGATALEAARDIRLARQNEVDADEIAPDAPPGTAPSWPHWGGLR